MLKLRQRRLDEIKVGQSADEVLDLIGKPRKTKVIGTEKRNGINNLIVLWTYKNIVLEIRRRNNQYRVFKIKERSK